MLLAGIVVALAGALEVQSEVDCPSAHAVVDRLGPLLNDGAPTGDRARVLADPAGVRIELRGPAGDLVAARSLSPGRCEDLAEAAAVAIAVWEGQLRSPSPSPLRLPRPPAPRRLGFEVAAAAAAALAGGDAAFGGALALALGRRGGRFLGRLELVGLSTREEVVGGGRASWTRAWAAVGPLVRFRPGRYLIDLHAEALVALLYARGVGFTATRTAYDVDPGIGAGGRAALRLGTLRLFAGVAGAGWLRPQTLLVGGSGATRDVPRLEALFVLGIAFGDD